MTLLQPITATPRAAVFMSDGVKGPHIGITYRCGSRRAQRLLHLAFHFKLVDESPTGATRLTKPMIITPAIDEEDLKVLAIFCSKRATLGTQDVPYGFRYVRSTFAAKDGGFVPGPGEIGLTCSTFVLAMFEWSRIALIESSTWIARPEDKTFHDKMIAHLKKVGASHEHIAAVSKETSCVRFRAEEVAYATASPTRPVAFAVAEAEGKRLSETYYEATAS